MVNIFENPAYYPVHHINTWTYYHCVPYAYTGENKLHFTKDDFKTLTREFAKLNELLLPASEVTFSVPIGEGINYYLYTHNSYFKQKKLMMLYCVYVTVRSRFTAINYVQLVGLRELCSKPPSLLYSEFPQKLYHAYYYAQNLLNILIILNFTAEFLQLSSLLRSKTTLILIS